MTLALREYENPQLSVVMVTHGAWQLTERAISTLAANTELPFELIVVDNDSKDETYSQLTQLRNVRLVLNEENRGFGPAVNQGTEQARGEYLLLLNTDAFVHEGWLEPLLEALARPGVGAAVPLYLHPDGSLQEAGVLLARDGTVLVHGDGDDPERACFRFPHTVDYGSAVCMLMRRRSFTELGGFDERYAPAYYEDADLCMRLAERDMAVAYEPRSTVTHVRYGSSGAEAAAHLSERNRKLFANRWASQLVGRPPTLTRASEQAVIAARDALATPRVLICSRPEETETGTLLDALLDGWPRARLTWATDSRPVDGFDPDRWLARGVGVIAERDPSWLEGRLLHYDLVVCSEEADAAALAAIESSQPQAARLVLGELDDEVDAFRSRLVAVLAAAGIAPPRG